jgi:hypothetical protein
MSDLENRTKPILDRLLADGVTVLGEADQETLATWAVKGAMVFEALRDGVQHFYSVQDRALLREAATLPPRTAVWAAKCIDLPGICVSASDHSDSPDHSPHGARLHATTMGFGHVALQVVTVSLPGHIPASVPVDTHVRPGPWEDATLRLSASGPAIRWPAKVGFNSELGLETFAARWFVSQA